MKKIAFMLAAGAFAFGVSARAADTVASTEYAIVTLPVIAGENLYGICVEATNANLTDIVTGLTGTDDIKKWNGNSYEGCTVAEFADKLGTVSKGDTFFVNAAVAGTAYQFGVAPAETNSVSGTLSAMDIVVPPFASTWSLTDLTFSTAGSTRFNTANQVYVWNGSGYDQYWYKNGAGWRNKISTNSVPASLGAGQAVFVKFGNGSTSSPASGTVRFAAP